MSGLLNLDDPQQQGLLSMALAMLAGSGPSPQKQTFGSILGRAGMVGMDEYRQAKRQKMLEEENARRSKLAEIQMSQIQQKLAEEKRWGDWISRYDPNETVTQSADGDYGPGEAPNVSVTRQKPSMAMDIFRNAPPDIRDDLVRAMFIKDKDKGGLPSDVQTAEWYRNATPEQRTAFNTTKRGLQLIAGIPHVPDANGNLVSLIPPEQVAAWKGQQGYASQYGPNEADAQQKLIPVTLPDGTLGYRTQSQIRGGPAPYNNPFPGGRFQNQQSVLQGAPQSAPQSAPAWLDEANAEAARRGRILEGRAQTGQTGAVPATALSRQELPPTVAIRPPEAAGPKIKQEEDKFRYEQKLSETYPKAKGSMNALNSNLDNMIATAKKIKNSPGLGWVSGVQSNVPAYMLRGTPGFDTASDIEVLQNQIVVETIKTLKELSSTGATGFGNMTEKEGSRLEQIRSPIKIGLRTEKMVQSLDELISWAESMKSTAGMVFVSEYGKIDPALKSNYLESLRQRHLSGN